MQQKIGEDVQYLKKLVNKRLSNKQPQKIQKQPQKIQKAQQILDKTSQQIEAKLKYSSFSTFAHQKELQVKKVEKLIQKTIRDALFSHFQALKEQTKRQMKIFKLHQQYKKQFEELLNNHEINSLWNIQRLIKDPIKEMIRMSNFRQNGFQNQMQRFIKMLNIVKAYSLIEGKIIKVNNLLMSQYLEHEKQIIIPTNIDKKIFVKAGGKGMIPSYVFLHDNKLMGKDAILNLNFEERKKIIDMVFLYLTETGVLIGRKTLEQKVATMLEQEQ